MASATAPSSARRDSEEGLYPKPERVRAALAAVNCGSIDVRAGREAAISVGIACPRGVVVV